jgi:radical SAM protein with 4Fe4S-binding SPASM domain
VLSVWGLEEFALDTRYLDYLLLRGEQLAHRSERRTNCLSPWQTIPVNVEGNLSLCDCQPGAVIGNIHRSALSDWWNGPAMIEQRRRMLGDNPPEACRVCPRF